MSRAMKYPLVSKRVTAAILLLLILSSGIFAQIPARPQPPRLVNDFASLLSQEDNATLERKLVSFADSTSNQIAVVIVKSLEGMDKSDFAYKIGESWGVGQSKFNNGVVILIKPKISNEKGEVFIATGYGVEGALPDAICKRIIEKEMIPFFINNDYYGGINAALKVMMPILSGEINSKDYATSVDDGSFDSGISGFVIIMIIVIIIIISVRGNRSDNIGGKGRKRGISPLDLLIMGSMLSGRGGRSGGFGGFGGGGFGGGGFGGFGGGGFGGGGAGGSW